MNYTEQNSASRVRVTYETIQCREMSVSCSEINGSSQAKIDRNGTNTSPHDAMVVQIEERAISFKYRSIKTDCALMMERFSFFSILAMSISEDQRSFGNYDKGPDDDVIW